MAEFTLNPGQGVAFSNNKKMNEKAPDLKGRLKLDRAYAEGEEITFAIWSKTNAKGPWLSMKMDKPFTPDPNYRRPEGSQPSYQPRSRSNDDDIPF